MSIDEPIQETGDQAEYDILMRSIAPVDLALYMQGQLLDPVKQQFICQEQAKPDSNIHRWIARLEDNNHRASLDRGVPTSAMPKNQQFPHVSKNIPGQFLACWQYARSRIRDFFSSHTQPSIPGVTFEELVLYAAGQLEDPLKKAYIDAQAQIPSSLICRRLRSIEKLCNAASSTP